MARSGRRPSAAAPVGKVVDLEGLNALRAAMALIEGPVMALHRVHARHGDLVAVRKSLSSSAKRLVLVADIRTARAVLQSPEAFRNLPLYPAKGPRDCAHRRLRNGVLGMNGDAHRHFRRLLMPVLTQEAVWALEARMREIAREEVASWREGDNVDLVALTSRLARRMALELIFGERQPDRGLQIARAIERHVTLCASAQAALLPLDWPGSAHRALLRQAERTESLLLDWVAERRGRTGDSDLMSVLIRSPGPFGDALSARAVAAQLWTLYGASFDTTAATLAWSLLLLAQHPARAQDLLDDYGAAPADGAPSAVAGRTIMEAMRLCTAAPFQAREVVAAGELPHGDGFMLQPGDHVVVAACVINRCPTAFPCPQDFRPSRWEEAGAATASLLTFGSGPRACPGFRFAHAALHATLQAIWTRWRITLEPGARIDHRISITLSPRRARVRLREQDGAFAATRVHGRSPAMTPALKGACGAR